MESNCARLLASLRKFEVTLAGLKNNTPISSLLESPDSPFKGSADFINSVMLASNEAMSMEGLVSDDGRDTISEVRAFATRIANEGAKIESNQFRSIISQTKIKIALHALTAEQRSIGLAREPVDVSEVERLIKSLRKSVDAVLASGLPDNVKFDLRTMITAAITQLELFQSGYHLSVHAVLAELIGWLEVREVSVGDDFGARYREVKSSVIDGVFDVANRVLIDLVLRISG